jgi:hypothetical protein
MRKLAIALLPIVLALPGTPVSAQDRTAPLPDGLAPSREAGVRGLYAEAAFGRIDVRDTLENLDSACKARATGAKVDGRDLLWKGKHRLYRSHRSVALVDDTPTIKVDSEACSATITLSRSATVKTGSWPGIRTGDWIGEHPQCTRVRRCRPRMVAGVTAQCADLGGGLGGSTICYPCRTISARTWSWPGRPTPMTAAA